MKILANRVNVICKTTISQSQQAFIKGRSITDAALDILTVMRNQKDQTASHWLLLLDQQKAFDRINHTFILKVLEKMNFNAGFISIVKSLFNSQTANIADAGIISEPFNVERRVWQEDPLSPLLYIIALNPLILKI